MVQGNYEKKEEIKKKKKVKRKFFYFSAFLRIIKKIVSFQSEINYTENISSALCK